MADAKTLETELNNILKDAHINPKEFKFEAQKDGSVSLKVSKETYEALLKSDNPHVQELFGSKKFDIQEVEKTSAVVLGHLPGAGRGSAANKAIPKDHVIVGKGLTEDDVQAFKDHIVPVKDALVDDDYKKARTDLDAMKSAGADPKLQGIADSVNTSRQILMFNVEGNTVVSHLTKEKKANLETVLASGVTMEQLFGSDKFKYDAKTGDLTVTGPLTPEEKSKFEANKGPISISLDGIGGQANPDVVKQLLGIKKAALEQEHGTSPGHTPVVAAVQADKGRSAVG